MFFNILYLDYFGEVLVVGVVIVFGGGIRDGFWSFIKILDGICIRFLVLWGVVFVLFVGFDVCEEFVGKLVGIV